MIEEVQLITYYLESKNNEYLASLGLDNSYFVSTSHIVNWIDNFKRDIGALPTLDTVANEFEDFHIYGQLENVEYLVKTVKSNKAYIDYRPVLIDNANMVESGNTLDAMWQMRSQLEELLKSHTATTTRYDWVKNATDRFDAYMEKHGQEGLNGITSGVKGLDDLTGGWKNDDLILLAGRLGEGKSLLGGLFAYNAWHSFVSAGIGSPVIFISTEMPKLEVAYRLDTLRQHFSNRALSEGKLSDPDMYKEYLEELEKKENSFIIMTQDDNKGNAFTPTDIRSIIEVEKPGLVVIDQLYDLSDGTGERDIRKRIVNISNEVRDINLSTMTPTILVAQAGRESAREMKKDSKASPEAHQIQESDNPAQKATRVVTLRLMDNVFKLSLKKNRGGVRNKDIFLSADIDLGYYKEIDEETIPF